jgi:hypothetical protein
VNSSSAADHHPLQISRCNSLISSSAINAAINAAPALIAGGGSAATAMIGNDTDHQSEAMVRAKSRVSVRAKCDGPMVGLTIDTSI